MKSYGIKAAYSLVFFKTFYQGAIEELDQYTEHFNVPTYPLDLPGLSGAKRQKCRVNIHAIDPKFEELNQMYWQDNENETAGRESPAEEDYYGTLKPEILIS